MKRRIRLPLLFIAAASLALWPFAHVVAQITDEENQAPSTAEPPVAIAGSPAVYTWSTTTTGFAWLNASHWTGNPGHYPGVDANAKSLADGASNDVAAFSSMAFAASIVGINFSPSSSNGVSTNTGANGSLTLGAINYLSTTNKSISIGDNSGTAGTLTLMQPSSRLLKRSTKVIDPCQFQVFARQNLQCSGAHSYLGRRSVRRNVWGAADSGFAARLGKRACGASVRWTAGRGCPHRIFWRWWGADAGGGMRHRRRCQRSRSRGHH